MLRTHQGGQSKFRIVRFIKRIFTNIFLSGIGPNDPNCYFDSCASISIVKDRSLLTNIREVEPIELQGVTGAKFITEAADATIWARDINGAFHCVTITDVLVDEDSPVNIFSVGQMAKQTHASAHFGEPDEPDQNYVVFCDGEVDVRLQLVICNGIYAFVTEMPEEAATADITGGLNYIAAVTRPDVTSIMPNMDHNDSDKVPELEDIEAGAREPRSSIYKIKTGPRGYIDSNGVTQQKSKVKWNEYGELTRWPKLRSSVTFETTESGAATNAPAHDNTVIIEDYESDKDDELTEPITVDNREDDVADEDQSNPVPASPTLTFDNTQPVFANYLSLEHPMEVEGGSALAPH
jgi:hypothetical protein